MDGFVWITYVAAVKRIVGMLTSRKPRLAIDFIHFQRHKRFPVPSPVSLNRTDLPHAAPINESSPFSIGLSSNMGALSTRHSPSTVHCHHQKCCQQCAFRFDSVCVSHRYVLEHLFTITKCHFSTNILFSIRFGMVGTRHLNNTLVKRLFYVSFFLEATKARFCQVAQTKLTPLANNCIIRHTHSILLIRDVFVRVAFTRGGDVCVCVCRSTFTPD